MENTAEPVDLPELMEIMDSDAELIRDCFQDFLRDEGQLLQDISAAIDIGSAALLDESAHRLKGMLRYLAATPSADCAFALEMMGKQQKLENAAGTYQDLVQECGRLKLFIRRYDHASP